MRSQSVTPAFVEGFVKRCMDLGFTQEQTEDHWLKHAYGNILARPNVYEGFRSRMQKASAVMTKAAQARWTHPDVLATLMENRIQYADTPMMQNLREELGLPEPSWDTVPASVKQAAANLSATVNQFDALPLNQKILLAMLIGGGVGGISRSVSPTGEDDALGRSRLNRVVRGGLRGAGIGAGTAAGVAAGSDVAGRFSPDLKLTGMAAGGALGALGGKSLADEVVR
jgi:hypothetical protein